MVRQVFRGINFFLLDGGGLTTRRYAGIAMQNVYSRESPYTPYIVDNQQLKSLHNSLHFLKSPYMIDGQ